MKEIQRISITDAVVDNIKEMIEAEEYKVGEKLPAEAKLCEMFKVSRTSVREALRVLQALGYVENKPGKGAFVAANCSPYSREEGFRKRYKEAGRNPSVLCRSK